MLERPTTNTPRPNIRFVVAKLTTIPPTLLFRILKKLSPEQLAALTLVNRSFRNYIVNCYQEITNELWQEKFKQHFHLQAPPNRHCYSLFTSTYRAQGEWLRSEYGSFASNRPWLKHINKIYSCIAEGDLEGLKRCALTASSIVGMYNRPHFFTHARKSNHPHILNYLYSLFENADPQVFQHNPLLYFALQFLQPIASINRLLGNDNASTQYIIYYAAVTGRVDCLRYYLAQGHDIERSPGKLTPVEVAADQGYTLTSHFLLQEMVKQNKLTTVFSLTAYDTLLEKYATTGDLAGVQALIKLDPSFIQRRTQAIIAKNNSSAIQTDHHKPLPLHAALRGGHPEIIRLCVTDPALLTTPVWEYDSIKRVNHYLSYLHIAVRLNKPSSVTTLLSLGMPVNLAEPTGYTPLYLAAQEGYEEIVDILLAHGAVINTTPSPLHIAAARGNIAIINKLLASQPSCVDYPSSSGNDMTALHFAARNGHLSAVTLLLSLGANLTRVDGIGSNLLHHAASQAHLDVMKYALARGFDASATNYYWDTPLHLVAKSPTGIKNARRVKDAITLLCHHHVPLEPQNLAGETPFYCSTRFHYHPAAIVLYRLGINPKITPYDGVTALFNAAHFSQMNTVTNLLLDRHFSVFDKLGTTPFLCFIVIRRLNQILPTVLSCKPLLDEQDAVGNTAVHYAVINNDRYAVKALANAGANVDIANGEGRKPINLAKGAMIQILISIMQERRAGVIPAPVFPVPVRAAGYDEDTEVETVVNDAESVTEMDVTNESVTEMDLPNPKRFRN